MTAPITFSQAVTAARIIGDANGRDVAMATRALRRFRLLIDSTQDSRGWLGRSEQWLLDPNNRTGLTDQDLSDALYGIVADEYEAALAMQHTVAA